MPIKETIKEKVTKTLEEATPKIKELASDANDYVTKTAAPAIKKAAIKTKDKTTEIAGIAKEKTLEYASDISEKALEKFDINKDGHFDFKDVLIMSLKIPGVKVNRDDFLRKSFAKVCKDETIENAIKETPAKAGIKLDTVNKIADNVIEYERNLVTSVSTGLGVVPGGAGIAISSSVADITQYYGFMIRVAQKLLYLYGFPQMDFANDDQPVDDGTMNVLLLCLGAMNGIREAACAIRGLAKGLANGISKSIMNKALTKGTIYPIIKKVWTFMGGKMTKNLLKDGVTKGFFIVGGVLSGGVTFFSFQKCCNNFKDAVYDTMLSNPDGHIDDDDIIYISIEEE